jgi:hypothetical protein
MNILVPLSAGELLDKITILRIKAARIEEPSKVANVRHELTLLERTWREAFGGTAGVETEEAELERVNGALWDIEDRIREHEARALFDAAFIELARAVYLRNDERAAIKRRINLKLNSPLLEEKSYRPYR